MTTVSLKDKPIPEDVDALVIAGPKQPMGERGKYLIDQFLMKGKAVAFLVDGMVIGSPRGMQMPGMDQPKIGQKNDTGLDDLLDFYGFKLHDDIVMEPRQNVPGPVVVEGQLMVANYPTFVLSTKLDEKSSIMDHVKGVIFPFASSIEQLKDKQPGLQVSALASSTPQAWRQTGFFLFDPQNAKLKVGDDKGPFVFAYSGQGKLKSFFAGKPYPNEKGEKIQPPDPNTSQPPGVERPQSESTGTARLVVVSDSDFASDEYLHLAPTWWTGWRRTRRWRRSGPRGCRAGRWFWAARSPPASSSTPTSSACRWRSSFSGFFVGGCARRAGSGCIFSRRPRQTWKKRHSTP